MIRIAEHAKWLEPYLNLEEGTIYLIHRFPSKKKGEIERGGLKIPRSQEDKDWGSDLDAIFASVPHDRSLQGIRDLIVGFEYTISKVNVRPPLISHEPEKYGVKREGIPLMEYLTKQPPKVWSMVTGVEFFIFEDIPRKYLNQKFKIAAD